MPQFRTHHFKYIADATEQRKVSQNRVLALAFIFKVKIKK
ncbi:hypothetical protein MGWOODY_Mmi587 [hydrothermal vent metagenome]|uniref:Uncharacterized protein n=1 Tax=hydrothermal vent metagenome TaxID=652676 RepID=A0A170QCJ0_9ZZZZ